MLFERKMQRIMEEGCLDFPMLAKFSKLIANRSSLFLQHAMQKKNIDVVAKKSRNRMQLKNESEEDS